MKGRYEVSDTSCGTCSCVGGDYGCNCTNHYHVNKYRNKEGAKEESVEEAIKEIEESRKEESRSEEILTRLCVIEEYLEVLMTQADDLKQAVSDLSAAVTKNAQDVKDEIARVEAVIAALGAGGTDPAVIAQAITDLKTVTTNLAASNATLEAERP